MRKLIAFCFLGTDLAMTNPSHAEPMLPIRSDVATDRAGKLYDEGVELYLAKRYAEAYTAYVAAWSLKKHYQIAANLGDCAMQLAKYRDAAEHLTYYLRESPKDSAPDKLEHAKALLEEAKKHIGTLEIVVDTPGVDVFVDGKVVGQSPLLGPVFVDPGKRLVEARRGRAADWWSVETIAGGAYGAHLRPQRVDAPAEPTTRNPKPGAAILLGVSIVTAGAGVGLFIAKDWASGRKGDEAEFGGTNNTIAEWNQTEKTLRSVGYASFALAGAVGVVGLVTLWRGSTSRPIDLAFVPAAGGGRVQVKLLF